MKMKFIEGNEQPTLSVNAWPAIYNLDIII